MLILQRKAGESVVIGQDVSITVLSIDSGHVRLAISAPGHIQILRSELVTAAQANRESAVDASAPDELLHLLGGVPSADKPGRTVPVSPKRQLRKEEEK